MGEQRNNAFHCVSHVLTQTRGAWGCCLLYRLCLDDNNTLVMLCPWHDRFHSVRTLTIEVIITAGNNLLSLIRYPRFYLLLGSLCTRPFPVNHRFRVFETRCLWFCNCSPLGVFLPLVLPWLGNTKHNTIGRLYVGCISSTRIIFRGVPGFVTDCSCGVWFRGLSTCLLYVIPVYVDLVLHNSCVILA